MHFESAYRDKTVLLTGHTGFKGSWLCEWLSMLGARVVGFSLPELPTTPSHFEELGLAERLGPAADLRSDVRSLDGLLQTISDTRPDYIFHLAAQPLVRLSFDEPLPTFETTALGSVNLLEAVRRIDHGCTVIMITTDKVYKNAEWQYAYRECDPLGGVDPYSASKACAEVMIASYRRAFFDATVSDLGRRPIAVASVRGGNVVGGGDWALDRIVPDCVRSLAAGRPIPVRNRHATRPWQHVLELLGGYLHLGALIDEAVDSGGERDLARLGELCSSFNFGPALTSNRTVQDLVESALEHWPGTWDDLTDPNAVHEAGRLNLTIEKAFHVLGWYSGWDFEQTVRETMAWYSAFYSAEERTPELVTELTRGQIRAYDEQLKLRS